MQTEVGLTVIDAEHWCKSDCPFIANRKCFSFLYNPLSIQEFSLTLISIAAKRFPCKLLGLQDTNEKAFP